MSSLRDALEAPLDRDDCPDAAQIWEAARGASGRAEPLLAHAAACGACAVAWRLARELVAESGTRMRAPGALSLQRLLPVLALAAAALVAVFALPLARRHPPPQQLRGQRARELRSTLPDSPQPRSGLVLRWTPAGPGARYDVKLATPELRVLFSARNLAEPLAPVPEAALAGVPPNAPLLFVVEAALPDGARASGVMSLRLQ